MEPDEARSLFEYLVESRHRFLDQFRELGWESFARSRGASWDSALYIYLHILDDEEGWLDIAARGGSLADGPDRKPEDYAGFEPLVADSTRVDAHTRAYLERLTSAELSRVVEFTWPGETVHRKVETILLHTFVDEVAHLGELIALLWQEKVKPPYLDFIDFRTT
jgi:uncharacterized damage-inducible protein DinB